MSETTSLFTVTAYITEFFESIIAKVQDKNNAKVVKTVADTFKDTTQTSYSDSDEAMRSVMFNIVEHTFTAVVCADQDCMFDKIHLDLLVESWLTWEQIIKIRFWSRKFFVPMADIVQKLVYKSPDDQCLKHMKGTSTPTIFTELSHKRSSSDRC